MFGICEFASEERIVSGDEKFCDDSGSLLKGENILGDSIAERDDEVAESTAPSINRGRPKSFSRTFGILRHGF